MITAMDIALGPTPIRGAGAAAGMSGRSSEYGSVLGFSANGGYSLAYIIKRSIWAMSCGYQADKLGPGIVGNVRWPDRAQRDPAIRRHGRSNK